MKSKNSYKKQIPRQLVYGVGLENRSSDDRGFDYQLDYVRLNLRKKSELYRVGRGEQGVLMVEPYKSEILPHWKFKDPEVAKISAKTITDLFYGYKKNEDFIGMDMARKFLQMGFTRSRRYANHKSGRKYDADLKVLDYENDPVKAKSAEVFFKAWQNVEGDSDYIFLKALWKQAFG